MDKDRTKEYFKDSELTIVELETLVLVKQNFEYSYTGSF